MRTGRILGFIVGGVIALLAMVMLAVWLLVDPNHYKDKIAAAVKDETGRDLMLQGSIKLSVFPWIALELGPASLGNPAGFGAQPFVSFRHAAVRAKLLPLIHERLEITRVEIDGLDLRLQKNAQGKGNWEGFGRSGHTPPAATASKNSGSPLDGLAGLKITDARVSYRQYTLEKFNLETAPFTDGVVPISLRFEANRGVASEHASVEAKVDFSNPAPKRYRFAAFTLIGQVVTRADDDRPLKWNFSTPGMNVDTNAQTLAVPALALTVAGAQMNGELAGTRIVDDPAFTGTFTLAPLVLREFMPRWGLNSPPTQDPRAFAQVAGSTAFAYGGNALRFDALRLTLDDTHLQGHVEVANLDSMAIKFELAADAINVDHYLPPEEAAPAPAAPAREAAKSEPSKPLDAQGTLAVGALHLSRLDLTDLKVTFSAKDGVTHLFPLTALVDGGKYSGDVTLDGRGAVPALSVDEHLLGVDMGKLLASNGKSIHLSGRGNFNVKATGHGAGADGILKTLNGHVDAYLTDGAVEGVDLGYELGRAEALIKRQDAPAAQNTKRTRFDAFKTTADIANGVATTKDLVISSQALKVTGQGSTNLANKALDFQLLADTLRATQGVPIQIPVKVTGTTADPTIRPDIEALAKGQLRQKLQDVLGDKLKGLFGKP
jgi:AsmA protein